MEVWKPVLLNRSGRPILDEGEHNVYVRDDIGLYQGRSKLLDRQNGRIYLTNKRIIYVDNAIHENSLAVNILDVDRLEASDRFLRSSPKIKAFLKDQSSFLSSSDNVAATKSSNIAEVPNSNPTPAAWICMICTFNNVSTAKVCASCGIKRRELSPLSQQSTGNNTPLATTPTPPLSAPIPDANDTLTCPNCTFHNHPTMRFCEICGSDLKANLDSSSQSTIPYSASQNASRKSLPVSIKLEDSKDANVKYIKFSFHKGGETKFKELLQEQVDHIKWESLAQSGKINKNGRKIIQRVQVDGVEFTPNEDDDNNTEDRRPKEHRQLGIHGLEQIGEQRRKLNELVLSTSLEDLEQLMYKAQDLIKLSESFSKLLKPVKVSSTLIPPLHIKKTSQLYHRELSRHISEYLANFALTKSTSMVTTQDLFAHYNRFLSSSQGFGTDLILSADLLTAIDLFQELNLPFKRKRYEQSGIVVITPRSTNDYASLISQYLIEQELSFQAVQGIDDELGWTREDAIYRGKTVGEIAEHFEWSYGIALEELQVCLDKATVVIDENIGGTFYFINKFNKEVHKELDKGPKPEVVKNEIVMPIEPIKKKVQEIETVQTFTTASHFAIKKGKLDERTNSMAVRDTISLPAAPIFDPEVASLPIVPTNVPHSDSTNESSTKTATLNELEGLNF
ncbi:hypothetical protein CAAN1_02S03114 [[Candida] anglica]|uniref:Vacuolar protein-sorting-associated protein 36 n=1 Tax=[Candida] anglica TaxID=148631 RepID=A0ABP0E6A6_9ASCO